MTNLELVKEYLDNEYKSTVRQFEWIDKGYSSFWSEKDKPTLVNHTISMCFGVVMFAQSLEGVEFEDIDPLYEKYKKDLENLLTK